MKYLSFKELWYITFFRLSRKIKKTHYSSSFSLFFNFLSFWIACHQAESQGSSKQNQYKMIFLRPESEQLAVGEHKCLVQ